MAIKDGDARAAMAATTVVARAGAGKGGKGKAAGGGGGMDVVGGVESGAESKCENWSVLEDGCIVPGTYIGACIEGVPTAELEAYLAWKGADGTGRVLLLSSLLEHENRLTVVTSRRRRYRIRYRIALLIRGICLFVCNCLFILSIT